MAILPKQPTLNTIAITIPTAYFAETDKLILKFIWEICDPEQLTQV